MKDCVNVVWRGEGASSNSQETKGKKEKQDTTRGAERFISVGFFSIPFGLIDKSHKRVARVRAHDGKSSVRGRINLKYIPPRMTPDASNDPIVVIV